MKQPKNFEEGICQLEEILATIADDATPIADAVALYADAAQLLAYCNTALASARLQIEEIDAKFQQNAPEETAIEDDIL